MKERISSTPLNGQSATNDSGDIDEQTLATLDQMDAEGLRKLVRLICGARWGEVALMSEDEAYDAVCLKMLHGGLTQSDIAKAMPALNSWAAQKKGTPTQNINQKVIVAKVDLAEIKKQSKIQTQKYLERIANL